MKPLNTTGAPSASVATELRTFAINGATPFWSHADGVHERLAEASALLTILASGYRNAEEYKGTSEPEIEISLTTMNHAIVASALEGIATLINLAQYHYINHDLPPVLREASHG